ncbi:MAG: hypothetical protein LRY35_03720 [Clostridiales bacterium]|nr:hypothetical protein [Clostridiales bacterium]
MQDRGRDRQDEIAGWAGQADQHGAALDRDVAGKAGWIDRDWLGPADTGKK